MKNQEFVRFVDEDLIIKIILNLISFDNIPRLDSILEENQKKKNSPIFKKMKIEPRTFQC